MDIRNFFNNKKTNKNKQEKQEKQENKEEIKQKEEKEKEKEKKEKNETLEESSSSISSISNSSNIITNSSINNTSSISSNENSLKIPIELQSIITWKPFEPVPYSAVASAFDKIAATSSRLEKESILCKLYRSIVLTTPQDLECVVYLTSNVVFPAYEGLELGIGDALLVKAVVEATGRNRAAVQAAYKADGDLGTVACQSRSSQSTLAFGMKPKPLTARFVLEQLRAITKISGSKSMDRKVEIIKKMMVSCQGDEAKYIVRALQGKLRIGTAAQTVLVGLAHAFATPPTASNSQSFVESSSSSTTTLTTSINNKNSKKNIENNNDDIEEEEEEEEEEEFEDGLEDSDDEVVNSKKSDKSNNKSKNSNKNKKNLKVKSSRKTIIEDEDDDEDNSNEVNIEDEQQIQEQIQEQEENNNQTENETSPPSQNSMETEVNELNNNQSSDVKNDMEVVLSNDTINFFPTSVPSLRFDSINDDNLFEVIKLIPQNPPPESIKLNTSKKLTKEIRNELAVIAVKRAFSECPSLSVLVDALLKNQNTLHNLHQYCTLTPGVPVAPMLAKPTKQVAEVLKRLSGQLFTMEYKYDGERAQIHLLEDGTVKIFSRNSEDNSLKYPEFLDVIRRAKKDIVTSCVIDAEVVAYDREKRCLLPFQILSTRKRKVEDGEEEQKVQVILQAFDMIYLNGKSLLKEPLILRRELLRQSFQHIESYFHFASGFDHFENGDTTPIEIFMSEACNFSCEGLMIKTLSENASYEPSKRSLNWLKLKKDYINGMGVCDSLDLVVIGGYHGRGKRTNVYGAYLVACYDPENDEYQSVCKVGTGFKDEDLVRLTEQLKQHIIINNKKPTNYNVGEQLTPDDWFEPSVVWEIQAADLSKSSVHKGGINRVDNSGRGIGLRFPRYIRDRNDKKAEMATTAEQIVEMYLSQGDNLVDGVVEDDEDEDII